MLTADLLRGIAIWSFGFASKEHVFVYQVTGLINEVFAFLVVLWLSAMILEPYPSLWLTAAVLMVSSFLTLSIWLGISAVGQADILGYLFKTALFSFHSLDAIFLLALNTIVLIFSLPVGLNVRGMLLGFSIQIAGLGMLQAAARLGWSMPSTYLAPGLYYLTLVVFVTTISTYQPGFVKYEDVFLKKKLDAPLFPILVRARLWNRHTYRLFYKRPAGHLAAGSWN